MIYEPIYDPKKPFEENYTNGPAGEYLKAGTYNNTGEPKATFFGHPVYLPFGVSAGPIFNSKFAKAAFNRGYDILVYKTVRTAAFACNPFPNIVPLKLSGDLTLTQAEEGVTVSKTYDEPLAITNSFGVPSVAPDVWQPDMEKTIKMAGKGQLVIGAFQGTGHGRGEEDFIKDHVQAARMVIECGAPLLEVNTSCPNEGTTNLLCFDVNRMEKIIHAVKSEIGNIPLIVKIAYFQDEPHLLDFVTRIGSMADGIAAINTISAKIYKEDHTQALPGEGRLRSGVCGSPIKWAGLEMVTRLKKIRETKGMKFTIIGGGGVTTPNDYHEYINNGADAVMTATGMMWNPYLAQEIKTK